MLFGNYDSFMGQEKPQENQFLTGNPSTDPGAQTDWMKPTDMSNTGFSGYGGGGQQQQQGAVAGNGTALDAMINGGGNFGGFGQTGSMMDMFRGQENNYRSQPGGANQNPWNDFTNSGWMDPNRGGGLGGLWNPPANMQFEQIQQGQPPFSGSMPGTGSFFPMPPNEMSQQQQGPPSPGQSRVGQYTPEGYDIGKLNDPAGANSTKYQVGRILSNLPPTPESLMSAAPELAKLGITVVGKDTIRLPDGTTADVGKAFSDPNGARAWQYNWSGAGNDMGGQQQQGQPQSFMGQPQQVNWQQFMNNMMNQQFQGQQANKGFLSQGRPNPQGGFFPMPPSSMYGNPGMGQGQQEQNNPYQRFPTSRPRRF